MYQGCVQTQFNNLTLHVPYYIHLLHITSFVNVFNALLIGADWNNATNVATRDIFPQACMENKIGYALGPGNGNASGSASHVVSKIRFKLKQYKIHLLNYFIFSIQACGYILLGVSR